MKSKKTLLAVLMVAGLVLACFGVSGCNKEQESQISISNEKTLEAKRGGRYGKNLGSPPYYQKKRMYMAK